MSVEHVRIQAADPISPRGERVGGGATLRIRAAAVLGLLSVIVSVVGLSIHGYPDLNASGKALANWATTTDQRNFAIGIYIEGLGIVLALLFDAWLWSVARDAEGGSGWISTMGFAAAVVSGGLAAVSNSIWSAILDAGQRGTSAQTLAAMQGLTNHVFRDDMFHGMFFVLIGFVLFRTRTLPRWVGATAMVIGLASLIPSVFFIVGMLPWVWTVAVSLYLLVRPDSAVTAREATTGLASPSAGSAR